MVTRKCYTCQIQKELDLFSKSAKDTKYGRKHECKDCVRDKRSGKLPKTYKRSFTGDHFTRTKITCGKCKNTKPVNDFRFHNKEKCIRHSTCKECTQKDRKYIRELNPGKERDKKLKFIYGITLLDYNQMLENQACNMSLGGFKDNIQSLKNAILYLEKHN